jgi:hypothetical protein
MSSASATNSDYSTALVLFRDDSIRERTLAMKPFAIDCRFVPIPLRSGPLPAALAAANDF